MMKAARHRRSRSTRTPHGRGRPKQFILLPSDWSHWNFLCKTGRNRDRDWNCLSVHVENGLETNHETNLIRRGMRHLGLHGGERGGGAALSVAPRHPDRAVRRRRAGRHLGARAERGDAGLARPAGGDRKRDRRIRHHRGRPRGARRARRLHREHRELAIACRQRRDLFAALRCVERLRAGRAAAQQPLRHRRKERPAGQGPQGADRMAQGQPGQGDARHRRTRRRPAHQRRLFPERHRHALPVRALPRRLLRDHARPGGRTHRPHL